MPQVFYEPAIGEFLQSRMLWPFTKQCNTWNIVGVCAHPFMWNMFYGPSSAISVDDTWLILNTWPATVASRTITHWAQVSGGVGGACLCGVWRKGSLKHTVHA
jgi:hypothetical protein